MSSSRVVRVHARDEVAARLAARRDRHDPGRAEGHPRLPARGRGGGAAQAADSPAAARPRPHRHPVRDHRPRGRRWTSTRRCTSSARAAATSCTTRSPTSRRSCEPGDPIDLAAHAARRDALRRRLQGPAPPDGRSPRARPPCCPTRCGPALLWTIHVDDTGEGTDVQVERARVAVDAPSSTTSGCRQAIDDGTADEVLQLLREVGELRLQREAARGGISLPLPEQEVDVDGRPVVAGVPLDDPGRDLERPDLDADRLRRRLADGLRPGRASCAPCRRPSRTTSSACTAWPGLSTSTGRPSSSTPTSSAGSTPGKPAEAAMITACARLLRGSGYVAFDGEMPADPIHAALASEYAHVTAPLRRLGDRYAGEICVALCAGTDVPDWVLARLPRAPRGDEGRRPSCRPVRSRWCSTWSRPACSTTRVGETLRGRRDRRRRQGRRPGARSPIQEPAVEARVTSTHAVPLGTEVEVRLTQADVASRSVVFTLD